MPRQDRKRAEKIIVDAIERLYPDLKVRPTTGNYILNQLLKGGFTNDKILSTPEEVVEDLSQAAFACKTEEAEDFSKLVPQTLLVSPRDMEVLGKMLVNPPKPNRKLKELFEKVNKGEAAILSAGPRPEQNVIITNIRPEVHFHGPADSPVSPCGNDDMNAPVTEHEFEITCKACKTALRKRKM